MFNSPSTFDLLISFGCLDCAKMFLNYKNNFPTEIRLQALLFTLRLNSVASVNHSFIVKQLFCITWNERLESDTFFDILSELKSMDKPLTVMKPEDIISDLKKQIQGANPDTHQQLTKNNVNSFAQKSFFRMVLAFSVKNSTGIYLETIHEITTYLQWLNENLDFDTGTEIIINLLEVVLRFCSSLDGVTEALVNNGFCNQLAGIFVKLNEKRLPIGHDYVQGLCYDILVVVSWLKSGESELIRLVRDENKSRRLDEFYYLASYLLRDNGRRMELDSRYQLRDSFMKRLKGYFRLFPVQISV